MSNLNEILLIYYMMDNNKPVNGPGAVIFNIVKNWNELGVNFKEISINPSKLFNIIKLIKEILMVKNKIINVHSYGSKIPLIILILSKINRKNSYYFTTHGSEYLQSINAGIKPSKYKVAIEKVLVSNYDNVICVSELQMKDLKRNFNIKGNISYINNGYDPKHTGEVLNKEVNIDSIIFLLAGGIKKNKGIMESLKIVKYLNDNIKHKKIIFNIIGDYIEEDYLVFSEYIKINNLEKNVNYLGFIDDKLEVTKLYLESDFVMSLSYYDTFNVSVIEALSLGKPVIVSTTTGASKFVNDYKNGIKVDLKNIKLENILKYIQNDDENILNQRVDLCKKSVENLTWKNTAENYLKILTK